MTQLAYMFHALPVRWFKKFQDGGFANQLLMAFMVTVPVFNFGMVMGWQSPMTPILKDPKGPAPEPITDNILSWMATLTFLPALFVGILAGHVTDRWGRKVGTIITSSLLAISWLLLMFSLRPWALLVSRTIAGIACAGCYTVTPLYLREIASEDVRGMLGSLFILSQNLGYLVIYIAGDNMSFYAVMWFCTLIPILHVILSLPTHETPVFLVKQKKHDDAKSALSWLRNTTIEDKLIQEEIEVMILAEEYAQSIQKPTWISILKNKTTFKAFRIAINIMLSQETSGFLVLLMYAGSIFDQASQSIGLVLSPNKQTIIVGAIQMVGSILASCIVEKTGRKWLLATTAFVMGLSLLTLGAWFFLTSLGFWMPGWLPVFAMCVCIFSNAAGYQPVPYIITSELFSFQHRGKVTSCISSIIAISDVIQSKAYDPLVKFIGIHWVFIIFSLVCFSGTIYTILWVPETRKRTLQEIYELLEGKEKKIIENIVEFELESIAQKQKIERSRL